MNTTLINGVPYFFEQSGTERTENWFETPRFWSKILVKTVKF